MSPLGRARYQRDLVVANTASRTMTVNDSGRTMTNLGATAGITFTLPAGREHDVYRFFCSAAYPMVITAGSADGMFVDGIQRANACSIMLWQIGHSATLRCDANGDFMVDQALPDGRDRCVLVENWNRPPGINADIQNSAEATREIVNTDFEVLGVSADSTEMTVNVEGGLAMATEGAEGDETILLPHLDASQSAWATTTWGTDRVVDWKARILTGSSVTNLIIWAGLKLTNTDVGVTDANQTYFRFEDDVSSGVWTTWTSNNDSDTTTVSSVTVATATQYDLWINYDSARLCRMFINNVLISTSAALKDTTDFIPYIGIENDGGAGAAKTLRVLTGYTISRKVG